MHLLAYRSGSFIEEPAPDWYLKAREHAEAGGQGWQEALAGATGSRPIEQGDPDGMGTVVVCRVPEGGIYVEVALGFAEAWAAVVPSRTDVPGFMKEYLLPWLQAFETAEQTWQLTRAANAFISYSRHGQGEHIDEIEGTSSY